MENIVNSPPASQGVDSKFFTPLVFSFLGVLATALSILVYHFFLVKYCMRRDQSTASRPVSEYPPPMLGVEKDVLDTIPLIAYTKSGLFRIDQSDCVVCLGELEDGDMVRLLPTCKHTFHVQCIDLWFMAHTSCPLCRSAIMSPVKEGAVQAPCTPPRATMNAHAPNSNQNLDCEDTVEVAGSGDNTAVPQPVSPVGMLRHCASMALPMETRSSRGLLAGLKRSLSLDQSFLIINMQRENTRANGSSSTRPQLTRSGFRSTRHLDRVSLKLLQSLSRLPMAKSNPILPY